MSFTNLDDFIEFENSLSLSLFFNSFLTRWFLCDNNIFFNFNVINSKAKKLYR